MKRDVLMLYLGYSLRYLAPLVLVPFYGRVLGVQSYGALLSAMALMQIVWAVVEWGLPITGARDVAAATTAQARGTILGTHLAARLPLALVVGAGAVAAASMSPILADEPALVAAAIVLGLVSACNTSWFFQGRLRFTAPVTIEMTGLAVSTAAILVVVDGPGAAWRVPAILAVVGAASVAVSLLLIARDTPLATWRPRGIVGVLRDAAPLFVHRGLVLLTGPATIFAFGLVAAPIQAAWYAAADRLANVMLAVLQPLGQIFNGHLYRSVGAMEQGADPADTHRLMRRVTFVVVGIAVAFGAVGFLGAGVWVPLIFGPGFEGTVPVFQAMCVAVPLVSVVTAGSAFLLIPLKRDATVAGLGLLGLPVTLAAVAAGGLVGGALGGGWGRVAGALFGVAAMGVVLHRAGLLRAVFGTRRLPAERPAHG